MDEQFLLLRIFFIRSDMDDSLYSYIYPVKILFNDFAM